jgi:hypothetical protein
MDLRKASDPATDKRTVGQGRAPVSIARDNRRQANTTSNQTQPAHFIRNAQSSIPWGEAVTEGQALVKEKDGVDRRVQMRLGEIAAKVQHPKKGDHVVGKLANAIGIASCTLWRYAKTWDAWDGDGKVAPGPVSFAVLRALKDHPDRLGIVTAEPHLTKREAEALMAEWWERNGGNPNKTRKPKKGRNKKPSPTDETNAWVADIIARTQALGHEIKLHQQVVHEHAEPALKQSLVEQLRNLAASFAQDEQDAPLAEAA